MATNKKWFGPRKHGVGFKPQTAEGVLITLAYIILLLVLTVIFVKRLGDPLFNQGVSVVIYLLLVGTLTGIFGITAYYTSDELTWNWKKR